MKYLDENGLRRFWQKTKEYVDLNSGGGGSGGSSSATYTKLINKKSIEVWTPADTRAIEDGEMFVAGETVELYKDDVSIGDFTVKDTDETERQTLAMIASQMGAEMNPISCTYISSVDNGLNLFVAGETGFMLATIDDANMGKIYLHYDNMTAEQIEVTYSIKENYSVPINASFFEPKLLWSGESADGLYTFELNDNYEKYQGYILVIKYPISDTEYHEIPLYTPRVDKTVYVGQFWLGSTNQTCQFIGTFNSLKTLQMAASIGSFSILAIYGCH